MRLTAYADESGHSADPGCHHIGIGAALANGVVWSELSRRWSDILRAHHVPHLHMREFAHCVGPFLGWTETQRRALLSPLLDAIVAAKPSIFGAVMSLSAWRALPPADQSLFIDPWFPCLQESAYLSAAHGSTVGQAPVDFIFSQNDEFQRRVGPLWKLLKERGTPFDALGGFSFADMRTEPCLQVADLATYEMVLAHDQVGRGATKVRYPFQRLRECDSYFRYIDATYLQAQVAGARRTS